MDISSKKDAVLTIFYDGNCPMCSSEMAHLKRNDDKDEIKLVDLHEVNFTENHPEIDFDSAMKILHGVYQGSNLLGLEVTHRAWTLVGKGFWVAPLNWPFFKQVAHKVYLLVAKYRHPISGWLSRTLGIGKPQCSSGVCYEKPKNSDQ